MEGLGYGPLVLFMTRKDLCPECHVLSVFMDGGRCDYPPSCKRGEGAGEARGARAGTAEQRAVNGGSGQPRGQRFQRGGSIHELLACRAGLLEAVSERMFILRALLCCLRMSLQRLLRSLGAAGAVLPEARADEGKGAKKVAFCMIGRKLV